jgi:hypothetical protein
VTRLEGAGSEEWEIFKPGIKTAWKDVGVGLKELAR